MRLGLSFRKGASICRRMPVGGRLALGRGIGYTRAMSAAITPRRQARIREVLARRQKGLTLVMDNIWDPHNVAAILRSCDAFGVLRVHLYYTREQYPDMMSRRASGSAVKWVDAEFHDDAVAMVTQLRAQGCRVIRTGFSSQARPLPEYDLSGSVAVILSNEHDGTSPELVGLVPDELYIPMYGMVQSFNVSVAGALILYEASRQRSAAGCYAAPTLTPEELDALALDWAER